MGGFDEPVVQYARNHVDEEALYQNIIVGQYFSHLQLGNVLRNLSHLVSSFAARFESYTATSIFLHLEARQASST